MLRTVKESMCASLKRLPKSKMSSGLSGQLAIRARKPCHENFKNGKQNSVKWLQLS